MNATIKYSLSTKGQKASLLAGGNGNESQTLSVEVNPSDLDLFSVSKDGTLSLVIERGSEPFEGRKAPFDESSYRLKYFDSPQSCDSLISFARELPATRAAREKEQQARQVEEAIDYFLTLATANDSSYGTDKEGGIYVGRNVTVMPAHPRFPEIRAARDARDVRLADKHAAKERERAERERKEAEDTAAAEARAEAETQWLAQWVEANGTDSQKERQAEGVMPRNELFRAIKDSLFGGRDEFRWSTHKPRCICEYETCSASHEVEDANELTDSQFSSLKELRFAFPDATVTARKHTITRDDCDETATVIAGKVDVIAGPFTFTRSFKLV